MNLELAQRAFLVDTHQPTIAGNVGREDRSQSSFDALLVHDNTFHCPFPRVGASLLQQGGFKGLGLFESATLQQC
jgi:hypothetical protein